MCCHKNACTAFLPGALPSEALNLPAVIDLVVFQHSKLHLLLLMLYLLWSSVVLLLSLLSTSSQPENQVKSGLFLDVIVRQGSAIF